ncbi:MAG: lipoprotein LenA [Leptospiraceae bacterium]|jgi:lipoprotein LenA|nr:lipoprotein LenA [Leptospiraceae bacterium]MCZ8347382.1 lipoprotein LenA [Leptospiraceae bacterium]PJD98603.1 MAG: lipoprotein LenA [Leptospira sp.]
MNHLKFWGLVALFAFVGCKDQSIIPDQIVGVRYANYTQWIYKEPGSKKKEDQVALVYGLEEVTAIDTKEISIQEGKEEKKEVYLKLKTVDNKEGYAVASGFAEAVYFILDGNLDAFVKPTLTSSTKGKVSRGSYCLLKETIGEFSKVDCKETVLQAGTNKLNDIYNVWVSNKETSLSNDPLLGETVKIMRQSSSDLLKIASQPGATENAKLIENNLKELDKAIEKNDAFIEDATQLKAQFSNIGLGE